MIVLTERAVEILAAAEAAARRFDPDARVRIARSPEGIRFEFADAPAPTDDVVVRDAFTLFVEADVDGVVDVAEPHDRLVLRPGTDG